ncbi:MAG: serine protease [Armatimonadota bacterium]|nr:serine protease [Armatimonadota bacterium]
MECPKCGYAMSPLDDACPRCQVRSCLTTLVVIAALCAGGFFFLKDRVPASWTASIRHVLPSRTSEPTPAPSPVVARADRHPTEKVTPEPTQGRASTIPSAVDKPQRGRLSATALQAVKAATVLIGRESGRGWATGSGFCVSNPRYLITNRHVVAERGGRPSACSVVFHSGTDRQKIISVQADDITLPRDDSDFPDFVSDLALIVLPDKVVEPLRLGNTDDLNETEDVYAVGFPLGPSVLTLHKGLPKVSLLKEDVQRLEQAKGITTVLQIGGSATHGNSGGPVIDLAGDVVGVVAAGHDATGIGYAIPTGFVRRLIEDYNRQN